MKAKPSSTVYIALKTPLLINLHVQQGEPHSWWIWPLVNVFSRLHVVCMILCQSVGGPRTLTDKAVQGVWACCNTHFNKGKELAATCTLTRETGLLQYALQESGLAETCTLIGETGSLQRALQATGCTCYNTHFNRENERQRIMAQVLTMATMGKDTTCPNSASDVGPRPKFSQESSYTP